MNAITLLALRFIAVALISIKLLLSTHQVDYIYEFYMTLTVIILCMFITVIDFTEKKYVLGSLYILITLLQAFTIYQNYNKL